MPVTSSKMEGRNNNTFEWTGGKIFYFPACTQLAFLIKCYIHKNYNNRYKNINSCYFLMGGTE